MKTERSRSPSTTPYRSEILLVAALMTGLMILVLSIVEAVGGEERGPTGTDPPWAVYVRAVDTALQAGDFTRARNAFNQAHAEALASRRWEGFVDVGDAALRIGEASGSRRLAAAKARRAYLTALSRSRATTSLDGVLRVAGAFAGLGDHEVIELCLQMAREIAGRDPSGQARARVERLTERLADRVTSGGGDVWTE